MNKKIEFQVIGTIHNHIDEPTDYRKIKDKPSTIEIFKKYQDALLGIEENDFLDIVFYFHKSEKTLQTDTKTYPGILSGVFSSRSPKRPNLVGVTTVKLIERKENTLIVQGLDAINGSPLLDIKNSDTSMFAYEYDNNPVHQNKLKKSPRIDIRNEIYSSRTDSLMIKAAQMHGHYCPGLAMGIMAATYAMNKMEAESDGMEDLLAITETNNCFSDGVQFVTGCTFGNNALIFKDLGKTAFTLVKRDGKGIRINSKPDSREVIQSAFPDFKNLYKKVVDEQNHDPALIAEYRKSSIERAFGTLTLPFDKLFDIKHVSIEIPEYAKIHDSVICAECKESIMKTRAVATKDNKYKCLSCSESDFNMLDGNGIHLLKS